MIPKIPKMDPTQIGGDCDPATHGAIIARADGLTIDLTEIQPVRACVGDREAQDVGFPFWTRTATYWADDLDTDNADVKAALESSGIDLSDVRPELLTVTIAQACLSYGLGVDEGPAGWAKDILPRERVQWWTSIRPNGWRFLACEDVEFRRMMREA